MAPARSVQRVRLTVAGTLLAALAFFSIGPGPSGGASTVEAAAPGEAEIRALAAAFADRITETAVRDGQWALLMDGTWYAWAEGRVLPESEASQYQQFTSMRFYRYPLTLPPLVPLSPEQAAQLQETVRRMREHPPVRNETFLQTLLNAGTQGETWQRIERARFLGFQVQVHGRIVEPLAAVEAEVRALTRADPEVAAFVASLSDIDGYNWRPIAGTRERSYHSYGLAVDLIPKRYRGYPYWQWAIDVGVKEWWAIPYEKRWMVPTPIVQAFERHGFVWGGKWLYFDTMHFEYRPEVLLLAGAAPTPLPSGAAAGAGPGGS